MGTWLTESEVAMTRDPRVKYEEPPMTDFDEVVIGGSVRLDIPFSDLRQFKFMADQLRGLADALEKAYSAKLPEVDHPDYQQERRTTMRGVAVYAKVIRNRIRYRHSGKKNKNGTYAKY